MKLKNVMVGSTRQLSRQVKSPLIRRVGIVSYRSVLSLARFLPPPRVLLVGPAKSGTHLLSDCVSFMPKMAFSGRHFTLEEFALPGEDAWREPFGRSHERPRIDAARLERFLRRCPPGMFATGHVRWSDSLQHMLDRLGYRTILLVRDPRDIAVSLVAHIMRERHHFLHDYYAGAFSDDGARLMAAIAGFEAPPDIPPQPSIGQYYAGYISWLVDDRALAVRFEDLVGRRGGGDEATQLDSIKKIARHVDRDVDDDMAYAIAERMYSSSSSTFRKGQIGDWRNHFQDEHRDVFKDLAGDVLIRLGYESNSAW